MVRKRGIQPDRSSQLPSTVVVPPERIDRSILLIRGEKVMLDMHLAPLYGVTVGRLNEAIRRNLNRFPADFMFQLAPEEWGNLKSRIAISSSWGGCRTIGCGILVPAGPMPS